MRNTSRIAENIHGDACCSLNLLTKDSRAIQVGREARPVEYTPSNLDREGSTFDSAAYHM
jgi:hypothetical protein